MSDKNVFTQNHLCSRADVFPPLINHKVKCVCYIFVSFQSEHGSVDHSLKNKYIIKKKTSNEML